MKRLFSIVSALVAIGVGFLMFQGGGQPLPPFLQALLKPAANGSPFGQPPPANKQSILIASFNIQVFGEAKMADPQAMQAIIAILRNFDLVAIQEIRSQTDILPRLCEMLNADGQRYFTYAIGPRLGRTDSKEQYAFVFDQATVELDRTQLYTLQDPSSLLHRPPLVGWFRARGPSPEQAFTFTLVPVHTDPDEVQRELNVLDDAFFAIRDDGRREDDVIMLGDFNASHRRLGELGAINGLAAVVTRDPISGVEVATNVRGDKQYDNILFLSNATTEFTGRGGVFDFLRQYNLPQQDALRVSDHLPVWAEFSVFEGGRNGQLATLPGAPR
jgi:deoxyribonuclease-1-like protein